MPVKPNNNVNSYSEDALVQLADLFRLMGDPTRLRIILVCLEEPISVGEIARTLDLSSSLVSHHLRLLKAARVLNAKRSGKHIFYSALDDHIRCVIHDMLVHVDESIDIDNID